jgi:serine/threonine protein kinase
MSGVEQLPAGSLLHYRYRVVRLVGLGGMGAVYEAVDQLLDNTVALKQMLRSGPESDRAFVHEAKVLASLRHPALPVVIDYFVENSGARGEKVMKDG